ncbi:uncharacterized protein LOC142922998 [Petromyzon marinus]|uniref:uncharacterized protein LOC142922998 n=1 Tax=Petromyzon marinus TaxID=7757 RepID=UPI003F71D239
MVVMVVDYYPSRVLTSTTRFKNLPVSVLEVDVGYLCGLERWTIDFCSSTRKLFGATAGVSGLRLREQQRRRHGEPGRVCACQGQDKRATQHFTAWVTAFVVMASKDPAYEIIRTNKVKLQEYLQAKSSEVLDHSQQAGIVLYSEYASLKSKTDPIARTRDLVDLVLDKGEEVCMRFIEAVLVPLRSEIPPLVQWISQHEQQLNVMGVDLSRSAGKAIPGAASHNPGDDYREFLLKLTSLTRDYNARPGEPAVFLLERMVKPILVPYYRHQETKQHELLARGKQHKELMKRAQREGMTYNNIFDLIGK